MLILSRHEGEAIKIGDDVTVVVKKVTAPNDSAKVHIAVQAPKTIEIKRAEEQGNKGQNRS